MIFGTLRLLIWLAGLLVVVYVGMSFFGYEFDGEYYHSHTLACQKDLQMCQKSFVQKGLEGAKATCHFNCMEFKYLIQKEEK
ncbi:MAG: hypothetical protein ABI747_02660 [Candidatus Moraniibacteriota bacterium]